MSDDTADGPENDQTVRAREQAGGLDHWAAVLEAHEPDSSAAGIVMLRAAAKTLRELAADAPPEPTEEMVEAKLVRGLCGAIRDRYENRAIPTAIRGWLDSLDAALAAAPKEG